MASAKMGFLGEYSLRHGNPYVERHSNWFKASDTSLAETTVNVSINYRRVIAELQGCGYTVDLQLDSMWKKARMSIKQRLFR
jgi:hypothetical protein